MTVSSAFLLRAGVAVFFAAFITLLYYFRFSLDRRLRSEKDPAWDDLKKRNLPIVSPVFLPIFLCTFAPLSVLFKGWSWSMERLLSLLVTILIEMVLFYLIMLLLLPTLRKQFSSRAVSFLWILPNYLYLTQYTFMDLSLPLLRISITRPAAMILLIIWTVLMASYLIFCCITHLLFRRRLLKDSKPIEEKTLLELWSEIRENAGIREKYSLPLLSCSCITTPLSIGLSTRSTKVLLPSDYSRFSVSDLTLILTHEAIHIKRQDAQTKFFLCFCTALSPEKYFFRRCFRRCSEDLELSVDEEITDSMNGENRKHYARLLLENIGDDRGFTTSLSSDGRALRYRMKQVVHPEKKKPGVLLIAGMLFLLLMGTGIVSLSFKDGTLDEAVFDRQLSSGGARLSFATYREPSGELFSRDWICSDEGKLNQYLSSLSLSHMPSLSGPLSNDEELVLNYDTPRGLVGLSIQKDTLTVTRFYEKHPARETYYIDGKADLEFIKGLFTKK